MLNISNLVKFIPWYSKLEWATYMCGHAPGCPHSPSTGKDCRQNPDSGGTAGHGAKYADYVLGSFLDDQGVL